MKYHVYFYDSSNSCVRDEIFIAKDREDLQIQTELYVNDVLKPEGLEVAGSNYFVKDYTPPKIGITEAGDASIDYSWESKMNDVDVAILITKNITDKFIESVMKVRDKVVIHATCTGYGGTILEPNVPLYTQQLDQVKKLINLGFPLNQIVIRIDPIIPTEKGVKNVENVVGYIYEYVKRFRISVIDNYRHVIERFKYFGLPVLFNGNFQASQEQFDNVDNMIKNLKDKYGVVFESCAEEKLKNAERIGCVSKKDLDIFGIELDCEDLKNNRKGCLCIANKTELLSHNSFRFCNKLKVPIISNVGICDENKNCKYCKDLFIYGCPNQCLYCYWRS